jgi:DNA-directed RNA polymerase
MSETRRRSEERFERQNPKNPSRPLIQLPHSNATIAELLDYLADYLDGKYEAKPARRPRFMVKRDARVLALATLAPLLDAIFRGWGDDSLSTAELKLCLAIGHELEVTPKRQVQAGDWLLLQAMDLDIFGHDDDGFPRISDKWQPEIARIRASMILANPSYAPFLRPPPPWNEWSKTYDDGFSARFVRDWRPETKAALNVAFLNPDFEHAGAVNALGRVPLKIDPVMVDLVERFAVDDNNGRVRVDVADARWCGDRPVWIDYSCDRRGRIYALQHLNFAREDHVRSLFRFANGMKLGGETKWLEIHCANCEGTTERQSQAVRIKWVGENKRLIQDIAKDPVGRFDRWKSIKNPFAFVAACRELAGAWEDPENFVTHLPVGFDGTANGLQHLSMLSDDYVSAGMVNLLPDVEDPSDVYEMVGKKAQELIGADSCYRARFWRERFDEMDARQTRKLLKQPVMTFAYSVKPYGAALQMAKVYKGPRPPGGVFIYKKVFSVAKRAFVARKKGGGPAFMYLAEMVLQACAKELEGPRAAMDYICALAEHCTDNDRFLEWTSPSGFPCSNRYQVPKVTRVECRHGSVRVRRNLADGVGGIRRAKVKNSAAPNYIHSLDAAHLAKVVNASVGEGITDILTIHDSYSCLAPQAARFHKIILDEMSGLYDDRRLLEELRARNVKDDSLPVLIMGQLILRYGRDSVSAYLRFAPKRVRRARNAFG